jgi:hypothetical protein
MDSQRVVVVLLLITIILSVVSVVLTLSVSVGSKDQSSIGAGQIKNPENLFSAQNSQVSFEVTSPSGAG